MAISDSFETLAFHRSTSLKPPLPPGAGEKVMLPASMTPLTVVTSGSFRLWRTSISICLNNSRPLPFLASITSCTARLIDSAASPGSTTITGATVNGVLAVTGMPPLIGIA